jgi:transcriptional regulator with XRE-family HTH domain
MSNLQRIRKEAGLTQSELAGRAKISLRTLQYYEQGSLDINKASAVTVWRLAMVLGCQMESLLNLDMIVDEE